MFSTSTWTVDGFRQRFGRFSPALARKVCVSTSSQRQPLLGHIKRERETDIEKERETDRERQREKERERDFLEGKDLHQRLPVIYEYPDIRFTTFYPHAWTVPIPG